MSSLRPLLLWEATATTPAGTVVDFVVASSGPGAGSVVEQRPKTFELAQSG